MVCVCACARALSPISQTRDVVLYCDMHGHSVKFNLFLYGCPLQDSFRDAPASRDRDHHISVHVQGKDARCKDAISCRTSHFQWDKAQQQVEEHAHELAAGIQHAGKGASCMERGTTGRALSCGGPNGGAWGTCISFGDAFAHVSTAYSAQVEILYVLEEHQCALRWLSSTHE